MRQIGFLERVAQALDERAVRNGVEAPAPKKALLFCKSLNHLYEIAACSRGRRGGDQVLEAVVGRCFNHSVARLHILTERLQVEKGYGLPRGKPFITGIVMV